MRATSNESTGRFMHRERPEIEIGTAYRSQTHKVFQTTWPHPSVLCMKTITLKKRWEIGRRLRQAGKQFPIDRAVGYFQGALVCIDQAGLGAGLMMGFVMLVSFLFHAVRSVAEKGVI